MNQNTTKLETDLNTLRSLIAVVEEGGFSAAAKRVHRTQSAVSVQIAKLEDQLNTKLLERTSRSVSLTPAGETFLSYARRMLELSHEATVAVNPQNEKEHLRVGFAEYLAPRYLHTLISGFREQHPHCELSMMLGLGPTLLESMERGELDLVIAGPEGKNGTVLWDEQLVWTGQLAPADNASLKLVLFPTPCIYRKIAFDALAQTARPWKLSIEANSFEAVQSAVRAGLGITVLPAAALKEDMPRIDHTLPALPKTTLQSYAPAHSVSPYIQPFIDDLIATSNRATSSQNPPANLPLH